MILGKRYVHPFQRLATATKLMGCKVKQDKSLALYKDPRYDAVGSSSLREELFAVWLAGVVGVDVVGKNENGKEKGASFPFGDD